MLDVIINDISIASLGIVTEAISPPPRPSRRYTKSVVPGRSGFVLTGDDSYNEVTREATVFASDNANLSDFWALLDDCREVRFSTDPNHTLKCCQIDPIDPEEFTLESSSMTVVFVCQPFRYKYPESGIYRITPGTEHVEVVENGGTAPCLPRISGAFTAETQITIAGYRVDINKRGAYVIDCESMMIYKSDGITPAGNWVGLPDGFPILQPGDNEIHVTEDVSRLSIRRRECDK